MDTFDRLQEHYNRCLKDDLTFQEIEEIEKEIKELQAKFVGQISRRLEDKREKNLN